MASNGSGTLLTSLAHGSPQTASRAAAEQVPTPKSGKPAPDADQVEVIFWNPVGVGRSSLGHVSVRIGNTSYSLAPNGMDMRPQDQYLHAQRDFRGGHGIVLDVPLESVPRIRASIQNFSGRYNYTENNCTTPIQEA